MTDDKTVRSATVAVACLEAALMDPDARGIVPTGDAACSRSASSTGVAELVGHPHNTSAGDRP